jgi:hypothetical protein
MECYSNSVRKIKKDLEKLFPKSKREYLILGIRVTYSYTDASIQCRLLSDSSMKTLTELCFKSTRSPSADYVILTLYPTNFTVLDEMLACSHYRTNPKVIHINQDVPTSFMLCNGVAYQ